MIMRKTVIYFILLLFTTIVALWGLPELVRTATLSRSAYPFVYFSSVQKKFMFRESDPSKMKFHDDEGREYTEEQYDKSLPLFNYRQLTVNGEMPDSIDGIYIDPRLMRVKSIVFRYSPAETHQPETGLYIMYESLPKKAKLESPGDVFRLKDDIQFIDDETNTLEAEKSELFRKALVKAGFTFPAAWTHGNLEIRKPYDEGYFSLDANGRLFHIKMVNGRPFVRDTKLPPEIEPAYFSMYEVADKRFYGLLFDRRGNVYILEEGYRPLRLDIDPLNLDSDELRIIGNMLWWTVTVQNSQGKKHYALDCATLKRQRDYYIEAPVNKWNKYAAYLFPAYLTFRSPLTAYIAPQVHFTAATALICNLLLAIAAALLLRAASLKRRAFNAAYTLVFGLAGIVALLILPNDN
jgi:hypothetical protein